MANFKEALLIVRAWVEHGSASPLRARIRLTHNVANGFEQTATVATPEAGAAIVKEWLEEVLVAGAPAAGAGEPAPK